MCLDPDCLSSSSVVVVGKKGKKGKKKKKKKRGERYEYLF